MRQDIQILRGISVLSVIFYHFEKDQFVNGYLGVDVFFIISGFLITNLIKSEISENNFNFKNFYIKRAKRIFPALISTSILTILIGLQNLTEEQFYEMLKGLKYSLLFGSNIYFSRIINYFSIDSDKNLIINLWSLSIEEQFYIIYPIFLIITFKVFKEKIIFIITLVIFISIFSNSLIVYEFFKMGKVFFSYENYLFYSPFTRAWQLLLGGLLSYVKPKFNLAINNIYVLTFIGIFLFIPKKVNFILALLPLVSILLLADKVASKNIVAKILTHVGNISFSLYLIHQPILAGLRNHNYFSTPSGLNYINLNSNFNNFILLMLIYIISLLNFKFIEQKFRFNIKNRNTYIKFIIATSFFFSLLFSFDEFIYKKIFDDSNNQVVEYKFKKGTNFLVKDNNELCISQDSISTACVFGKSNNNLIFLGDSTISSLISGFLNDEVLNRYKIIDYTQAGCIPVIGVCNFTENKQYYKDIKNIKNSTIILGGRQNIDLIDKKYLEETLHLLLENQNYVIFVGYIPRHLVDEKMYFRKNNSFLMHKNKIFFDAQNNENEKYNFEISQIFSRINNDQLHFEEVFNIFCVDLNCNSLDSKGNYFFNDYSHLSYEGALYLYEKSNFKSLLNKSY